MLLRAVSSFHKYPDHIHPAEISSNDGIFVLAARNGYECAQVLIFADQDMEYTISIPDLQDEHGIAYASSNVTIYAEKYIFVDRNWHTNGLPTGMYPDALLPIENAMCYGENKIEAGKNKGVWLEFFIPAEQKPGIYHGTVIVNGSVTQTIPITIEVLNVNIPDHTGVRSLFHTNYEHMSHYEKGNIEQIHDKYIDYLLAHRIDQTEFSHTPNTDEGIAAFVDKADKLYQRGFHTFSLPSIDKTINGFTTFDEVYLEKYIFALAQKSLETGHNLVKDIAFYDWRIDEPFCANMKPGQVESAITRFAACTRSLYEKCLKLPEFQTPFGNEVALSIKHACHVVTDYYRKPYRAGNSKLRENGETYQYARELVTLCPPFDGYDTPDLVADYEPCQQRWWYGCNCPNAPFISYHIDDATYSPRMVGDLMARFNIVGNLYWANNICIEINTTGSPLFLEDPYDVAHRGFGANGEGAILYPGTQYGVFGPVGSIRVKEIREGNQDWDIFAQVKARYSALGHAFENPMDRILCYLCDGTKIDSIDGNYALVHEALLRLSEAALAPLGLTLQCQELENGVSYKVKTLKPVSLAIGGVPVSGEDQTFSFFLPYVTDKWFTMSVCSDDGVRNIPIHQGKGMQIILHESLFACNAVTVSHGSVTQNYDAVRREVTVDMDSDATIHIELGTVVREGQKLGFEIKTVEPCLCEVFADGYEDGKQQIQTITRWNRIQIPTDRVGFSTSGIQIRFSGSRKVGIGAVYIRR